MLWSTLSEPLNIPIHPNRTGETVKVTRDQESGITEQDYTSLLLRQVTQRVEMGREILGYLRVSHPWFEVTKPIRQLVFDLSLGTGLMVLSVAMSGWFLSGKAMEPVRESYQRLKQFTADASHELRSPITLIQTNVQVALADPDLLKLPDAAALHHRQQLKVVERLTKRLGRLVDDLLFLARQDSGIIQPQFSLCPLDALLMEVIEEQQLVAAEKKIVFSLDLVEPPDTKAIYTNSGEASSPQLTPELIDSWFTLQGDWNQLARLFTNLIGNAVQYTPTGGQVKVKLQRTATFKGSLSLTPRSPLNYLQVVVSDTGIGIPESALPRLFDRFYRVDPARTHTATTSTGETPTGSGLGLAIAAAIVENHGGQIQVTSVSHQGTTFTVTLPLTAS